MNPAANTTTLLQTLGPGLESQPLRASAAREPAHPLGDPEQPTVSAAPLRLHREAEIPRILAATAEEVHDGATAGSSHDGARADELATTLQERRQIIAIARVVCQATAEVLSGLRQARQLSKWLAPEIYDKVRQRSELLARHRREAIVTAGPLAFGTIRTSHMNTGVWEVSVVFRDEHRVRACAMQLQAHRKRWRVSAMELG